jgi:putative sterol carrier protein
LAETEALARALDAFVDRFQAEPRLKAMTAGWDRTIAIEPTDLAAPFWLRVEGGTLRRLPGPPAVPPEITMRAASDLLRAVFAGETSPTEPYMSGELRLIASEADVMRLDVITLMVWGG